MKSRVVALYCLAAGTAAIVVGGVTTSVALAAAALDYGLVLRRT